MTLLEKVARALVRRRVELEIEADGFAVPTNPDWWTENTSIDDADIAEARAALTALLDPGLIDELDDAADAAGDKSDHVRICDSRAEFPTEFCAAIQHILKGKAE